MEFLQGIGLQLVHVTDSHARSTRTFDGREHGHLGSQGARADRTRIRNRLTLLFDGVNDQRDLVILDHVHDVRATFANLVDDSHRAHPGLLQIIRRSLRRDDLETHLDKFARHIDSLGPIGLLDADKGRARRRQARASRKLALDESLGEGLADPHHLARGLHLRAEDRIDARELVERENGFLDRVVRRHDLVGHPLGSQALTRHAARCDLRERQ